MSCNLISQHHSLIVFAGYIGYLCFGAYIFLILEAPHEVTFICMHYCKISRTDRKSTTLLKAEKGNTFYFIGHVITFFKLSASGSLGDILECSTII